MGTGSITVSAETTTGAVAKQSSDQNWLTIPNAISLARLLLVPVFIWILLVEENRAAAAIVLAWLGVTDWLDGFIARRFGRVSTVGKVLDPVADRVFFIGGVGAIMIDGSAPTMVLAAVLARELIAASAFLVVATRSRRRVDVHWTGKTGAFFLMFALPLFVLGAHDGYSLASTATHIAWWFAIPGIIFGYVSFRPYVSALRTPAAASHAG